MVIYINHQKVLTKSGDHRPSQMTRAKCVIGGAALDQIDPSAISNHFVGEMSLFNVYAGAMTDAEVLTAYKAVFPVLEHGAWRVALLPRPCAAPRRRRRPSHRSSVAPSRRERGLTLPPPPSSSRLHTPQRGILHPRRAQRGRCPRSAPRRSRTRSLEVLLRGPFNALSYHPARQAVAAQRSLQTTTLWQRPIQNSRARAGQSRSSLLRGWRRMRRRTPRSSSAVR